MNRKGRKEMAIFITGDLFRYRNKSPYLDVRIIPIDAIKQRK